MNANETNVDKAYDIADVTPRPWWTMMGDELPEHLRPHAFINADTGTVVAQCDFNSNQDTVHANASHIVRCVNAHEALVEALRMIACQACEKTELWKSGVEYMQETARAALKAAGVNVD